MKDLVFLTGLFFHFHYADIFVGIVQAFLAGLIFATEREIAGKRKNG
jgi:hypothetical protein